MGDGTDAVNKHQKALDNCYELEVIDVEHYTDSLFKFTTTRPDVFRFRSGEFVMIALPTMDNLVFRAYSLASPVWDEQLEFFSIKVQNGPLTEYLQKIKPGDKILMRKKSTGTLVLDALTKGKRLYLLSTGTGFAPFASLIRDPETYEKFEQIILVQTTRYVPELEYAKQVVAGLKEHPLLGEFYEQLRFYPMTTREASEYMGRITAALSTGSFYKDTGLPILNPESDRIMICGSSSMLADLKAMVSELGFVEGANNAPASFVVEKAFVT